VREPRNHVHRVERRRELREVEPRLRLRQADASVGARGAKVRAEVATAGAHCRDEVRFHQVGRGRRGRHEVEIVEAREERARRVVVVVVVVVVRWDDAAGAVEREERPHLRGDAPGGGDRDPAPAGGSAPQGRHLDDERLGAVGASTRADAADRGKRRGGAMEVSAGSSESGGRSTRDRRDDEWEDEYEYEVPRPVGRRTWRNRREPRARRSRTSPRRTSPAVAARPSRWTSRAARGRARLLNVEGGRGEVKK